MSLDFAVATVQGRTCMHSNDVMIMMRSKLYVMIMMRSKLCPDEEYT